MRAKLSSRPSTSITSKIPGEASEPVNAARSGCATALGEMAQLFFEGLGPPLDGGEVGGQRAKAVARLRGQRLGGVGSHKKLAECAALFRPTVEAQGGVFSHSRYCIAKFERRLIIGGPALFSGQLRQPPAGVTIEVHRWTATTRVSAL